MNDDYDPADFGDTPDSTERVVRVMTSKAHPPMQGAAIFDPNSNVPIHPGLPIEKSMEAKLAAANPGDPNNRRPVSLGTPLLIHAPPLAPVLAEPVRPTPRTPTPRQRPQPSTVTSMNDVDPEDFGGVADVQQMFAAPKPKPAAERVSRPLTLDTLYSLLLVAEHDPARNAKLRELQQQFRDEEDRELQPGE